MSMRGKDLFEVLNLSYKDEVKKVYEVKHRSNKQRFIMEVLHKNNYKLRWRENRVKMFPYDGNSRYTQLAYSFQTKNFDYFVLTYCSRNKSLKNFLYENALDKNTIKYLLKELVVLQRFSKDSNFNFQLIHQDDIFFQNDGRLFVRRKIDEIKSWNFNNCIHCVVEQCRELHDGMDSKINSTHAHITLTSLIKWLLESTEKHTELDREKLTEKTNRIAKSLAAILYDEILNVKNKQNAVPETVEKYVKMTADISKSLFIPYVENEIHENMLDESSSTIMRSKNTSRIEKYEQRLQELRRFKQEYEKTSIATVTKTHPIKPITAKEIFFNQLYDENPHIKNILLKYNLLTTNHINASHDFNQSKNCSDGFNDFYNITRFGEETSTQIMFDITIPNDQILQGTIEENRANTATQTKYEIETLAKQDPDTDLKNDLGTNLEQDLETPQINEFGKVSQDNVETKPDDETAVYNSVEVIKENVRADSLDEESSIDSRDEKVSEVEIESGKINSDKEMNPSKQQAPPMSLPLITISNAADMAKIDDIKDDDALHGDVKLETKDDEIDTLLTNLETITEKRTRKVSGFLRRHHSDISLRQESNTSFYTQSLDLDHRDKSDRGQRNSITNIKVTPVDKSDAINTENKHVKLIDIFQNYKKDTPFSQLSLDGKPSFQPPCEDCEQIDENFNIIFICEKCLKKRRLRKSIIKELIETEINYGNDLRIIKEEFYNPIKTNRILTDDDIYNIFLNLQELIDLNQKLIRSLKEELTACRERGDNEFIGLQIGALFLHHIKNFETFELYCKKQHQAVETVKEAESKSILFKLFLTESLKENLLCRKMDLNSYLAMPPQRLMKYPLLLKQIWKYSSENDRDRARVFEALRKIEDQITKINESTNVTTIKRSKSPIRKTYSRGRSNSAGFNGHYLTSLDDRKCKKFLTNSECWSEEKIEILYKNTDNRYSSEDLLKKRKKVQFTSCVALYEPSENYVEHFMKRKHNSIPNHVSAKDAVLLLITEEKTNKQWSVFRTLHLRDVIVCSALKETKSFTLNSIEGESITLQAKNVEDATNLKSILQDVTKTLKVKWRCRRNAMSNIMIPNLS